MPRRGVRVEFTKEHDDYLIKYLAKYCPSKSDCRSGRKVFQHLVDDENKLWPWSVHHTWQSWRERYVKNEQYFDRRILNYQRKHNIQQVEGKKRPGMPIPTEMSGPPAKRVKLEVKSEIHPDQSSDTQNASSNSPRVKPVSPKPQAPSQAPPPREPEPTDVRSSSLPRSGANTDADAAEKPSSDLQTRHEISEISSSPNQPPPPPTDGEPEPNSSPRAVKHIKRRRRPPSDVFASEPPSPREDPVVDDVTGTLVADTVRPRTPSHVVHSPHGQESVDQNGHVPRPFPLGEEDRAEEGHSEDNARWPPPRGRTAKQTTASRPDAQTDAHHPFSQSQLQPRPELPQDGVATAGHEQGKQLHPFACVPRKFGRTTSDRRAIAAQFTAGTSHGVTPRMERERREDVIQNGASPVKRTAPAPLTSALLSGAIPHRAPKTPKFPVPRASTRSPFRPKPPVEEIRHLPHPRSQTGAAPHPALSRIRRQTFGHEYGNTGGNKQEHERGRGRDRWRVPSVDLVAMSRESTRSHSRSSTGTSVPARPPRWSLPVFAQATPRVIDESEDASGSVSGSGSGSLFRWAAYPPIQADILKRPRTSSLRESPGSRFVLTPSPTHSVTAVAASTDMDANALVLHSDTVHASPRLSLSPHPADIPLVHLHGLGSILTHMSVNHGFVLSVVKAVYARVRSFREADEVLRGMREAAEGFGERVIERGVRWRRNGAGRGRRSRVGREEREKARERQLRYVTASEDGEESEYSPPETSRAAMWKQQSESTSCAEEGAEVEAEAAMEAEAEAGDGEGVMEDGSGEEDDEEEEEGRAVEEQLCVREGENDDEHKTRDEHHDFSLVLLENEKMQELENKVGRTQFRRDMVSRFQ